VTASSVLNLAKIHKLAADRPQRFHVRPSYQTSVNQSFNRSQALSSMEVSKIQTVLTDREVKQSPQFSVIASQQQIKKHDQSLCDVPEVAQQIDEDTPSDDVFSLFDEVQTQQSAHKPKDESSSQKTIIEEVPSTMLRNYIKDGYECFVEAIYVVDGKRKKKIRKKKIQGGTSLKATVQPSVIVS